MHPADRPHLEKSGLLHPPIYGFAGYQAALRSGGFADRKLHKTLLPVPYLGNIAEAKVLILLLNPGLSAVDFFAEETSAELCSEIRRTIRQERTDHLFLDTAWVWTGGFSWWEAKLRDIASIAAEQMFSGRYGAALDHLAKNVAAIELVPYHSRIFAGPYGLPSSEAAKEAAKEIARNPERTVIVTRGAAHWGLEEQDNVVVYRSAEARGARLSRKSRGGQAILKALGLSV
ncbi:MAG: hypothetical protein AAF667_20425 [Pseudomonadota bacterium]